MDAEAASAIQGLVRYVTLGGMWLASGMVLALAPGSELLGFVVGSMVWVVFLAFAASYAGGRYRHRFSVARGDAHPRRSLPGRL